MKSLKEYLLDHRKPVPEWLTEFSPGDPAPMKDFLASRTVFYPGHGDDGHPIKVFGGSHSAHCFVMADYSYSQETIEQQLNDPTFGFIGYQRLAQIQLHEHEFIKDGWIQHVEPNTHWRNQDIYSSAPIKDHSFGFLEILQRKDDFDETHGAERLAILFLGADGHATYDALYCQTYSEAPPYAILLQDHGFGGNYNKFGRTGLLERIARTCNVYPEWILVGQGTDPWHSYEAVPDVEGDRAGMHYLMRVLYRRNHEHGFSGPRYPGH